MGGAVARCGFHAESTAHHLHPFPHAQQAKSFIAFAMHYSRHVEGFAVVMNIHADAHWKFSNIQFYPAGFGVAGHIGERLLRHAKEHGSPADVQLFHAGKGLQMNANTGAPGKGLGIGMQRSSRAN